MPLKKIFKSDESSNRKTEQVTVAVMLFRLVRSDGEAKMLELVHMSELLRKEFSLTQEELEAVFKLANEEESQLTDTMQFVEEICQEMNDQKRIKLLEYLWILAFADDKIEESEVSLIKSVAQKLQLSELEQASAQENAEKHLGLDLF